MRKGLNTYKHIMPRVRGSDCKRNIKCFINVIDTKRASIFDSFNTISQNEK